MSNDEFLRRLAEYEKQRKKKTRMGIFKVLAFIGVAIIAFTLIVSNTEPVKEAPKTPEEARKEQIGQLFSAWDGSLPALERVVKDAMNDPDSYEHVETRYWDMGEDLLIVQTTFRGKNKFGGVVKNSVTAEVDLSGKVLKIVSQGE